jgi:hypothetical protein
MVGGFGEHTRFVYLSIYLFIYLSGCVCTIVCVFFLYFASLFPSTCEDDDRRWQWVSTFTFFCTSHFAQFVPNSHQTFLGTNVTHRQSNKIMDYFGSPEWNQKPEKIIKSKHKQIRKTFVNENRICFAYCPEQPTSTYSTPTAEGYSCGKGRNLGFRSPSPALGFSLGFPRERPRMLRSAIADRWQAAMFLLRRSAAIFLCCNSGVLKSTIYWPRCVLHHTVCSDVQSRPTKGKLGLGLDVDLLMPRMLNLQKLTVVSLFCHW